MAIQTNEEKLRNLIAENLGVDAEAVTPAATLESLDADSLDVAEVFIGIEDVFGIEISSTDEDVIGEMTFESLVEYVTKKVDSIH